MGQTTYLLDTNAVIDFLSDRLPHNGTVLMASVVDQVPNISVITQIELLGFNAPSGEMSLLNEFVNASTIYPLSDSVVNTCIQLRKEQSIKIPDAIIASTAIVHNQILVTRNLSDFKLVKRLQIFDPHTV
ncbi:type II toxin-antitoxin system VapC family toxin [Rhodohalobacter sp. SW132]|uniref:type II toxin-antitoxin system VapC family toxin n=1 Tax=Rhodohalobacter sp. SW132 TaxID=2293433 RepID=UPI000E244223|nr:type II toxin-antitoxin system VapC family toxin [Rhodohalobacter sp. SW132]REL24274.1 type II toxin-antitoxin system VapC family toxin [Rhodohalobacter sp. SW132]